MASADVGLTVSATAKTARARPSQPPEDGRLASGLGFAAGGVEGRGDLQAPLFEQLRPAGDDGGVEVGDAFDAEALAVLEADGLGELTDLALGRGGDGARNRVLAGVLDRADQPQRLLAVGVHR